MSHNWRTTTLGNFLEFKRGYDLPAQNRKPGPFPIVSSSGISDYHENAMVKGPGVVTGRYGTIGEVFFVNSDFWPLNTTLYVNDFKGNDPLFTYYLLKTLDYQKFSDKAAVPGINRNDLHRIEINIPTNIGEQRRVAGILRLLDAKVELNHQICATLEEIARTIFRSWFVDFDPVRAKIAAKAEGRDPERAAMAAISGKTDAELDSILPEVYTPLAQTAALFPDSFVESDIGPVPEDWQIKPIGECAEILGGSTPSTTDSSFWDGEIRWATPKDLSRLNSPILLNTERRITETGLSTISSGLLPQGTILMSSRAPIGYLAITTIPVAINQGFIALKPTRGIPEYFLFHWVQANLDKIKARANGSTFLEISKSSFRSIPALIPNPLILSAFKNIVAPMFKRMVLAEEESLVLATTRDSLLPKLLAGELI